MDFEVVSMVDIFTRLRIVIKIITPAKKTIERYQNAQSKLANIIFTYELSERLKGTGVTANCLHPGAVATNMGINRDTGFGTLITRLLKPFFQTSRHGAETAIYLATSNDVEGVNGRYFYRKRSVPSSKRSYDKATAKKLWGLSEKMVNLMLADSGPNA